MDTSRISVTEKRESRTASKSVAAPILGRAAVSTAVMSSNARADIESLKQDRDLPGIEKTSSRSWFQVLERTTGQGVEDLLGPVNSQLRVDSGEHVFGKDGSGFIPFWLDNFLSTIVGHAESASAFNA